MSELIIRRVLIACDAACDIQEAVEGAAALADRSNAALHGVFLEDENLYRLAGLPFGRQVKLPFVAAQALDHDEIEKLSSAMGAAMRRSLAEAARQRGLGWSFDVVRGFPGAAALAEFEADILIIQEATRLFSGSWRPRSSWSELSEGYSRTMLIRRTMRSPARTAVILLDKQENRERILLAGHAVANPQHEVVVLLRDGTDSAIAAVSQAFEPLALASGRKIRWEVASAGMPNVLREIVQLEPALVVTGAGEKANDQVVRDLIAATRCDVLVVR